MYLGVVTRLAGSGAGSIDGTGSAAKFAGPVGISVSSLGSVYVADLGNHLVRTISPTGTIVSMILRRYQS